MNASRWIAVAAWLVAALGALHLIACWALERPPNVMAFAWPLLWAYSVHERVLGAVTRSVRHE